MRVKGTFSDPLNFSGIFSDPFIFLKKISDPLKNAPSRYRGEKMTDPLALNVSYDSNHLSPQIFLKFDPFEPTKFLKIRHI